MTTLQKCKKYEWTIGEQIGSGGFGRVHRAFSEGEAKAAIKYVPKDPGAERELLFAETQGVKNVIPIIDSGETDTDWLIVMPLAETSLRDYLAGSDYPPPIEETVKILNDIATALASIDGQVVHRDLKPENVLLLNGVWCLADFGISRYAEATTGVDTKKFALTAQYAAPERWRSERATIATDIYALGVVMYELVTGRLPFVGPAIEDFREDHLHKDAPAIIEASAAIQTLVEECLFKAPEARPRPANFIARLDRLKVNNRSGAFAALQGVNRDIIRASAETARLASEHRSETEKRQALLKSASKTLDRIYKTISETIQSGAPATTMSEGHGGIELKLQDATLNLVPASNANNSWGKYGSPSFDVVACAEIDLKISRDRYQYGGRSHSLWYCDAKVAGEYAWYETAFMVSPLLGKQSVQAPFSLAKGDESAQAILPIMASFQQAWPVERVSADDMDDFLERWIGWFAKAAKGELRRSSMMPEINIGPDQKFR